VISGSPADQAGLRGGYKAYPWDDGWVVIGGDIIVAANGQTVQSVEELADLIAQMQPGQKISLTILRDGKEIEVPVTLAARPTQTL
jgi:S1-C subfamily serine protease